jgi:hypothetical protein
LWSSFKGRHQETPSFCFAFALLCSSPLFFCRCPFLPLPVFVVARFCRCPFLPLPVFAVVCFTVVCFTVARFAVVRFCRHPERSEGSLYFVFAFAVAFLLVIPEGDLLLHL